MNSFLFVGVSNVSATQGDFLGDAFGYNNNISLVIRIYKQIKQPDMFLAFNTIPILLNQITRLWLANIINDEGDFTISNVSINNAEPTFDYSSDNSLNDFSSIKGLIVELNVSFNVYSN